MAGDESLRFEVEGAGAVRDVDAARRRLGGSYYVFLARLPDELAALGVATVRY